MFKVLLIVFVIGGGSNIEYNTGFMFQEFYSMKDCETVQTQMKELADNWTYKSGEKIPSHYSTKCVTMDEYHSYSTSSYIGEDEAEPSPPVTPSSPPRKHKRWDQ